ncbi:TetR/AcrR family transcriptional regulator [Streptomyces sp. NPDC057238]|uniref:TetR/AcrR family transcriptional regulator n=1 Tax=unclassified Streptomyces TaxID=2593676 RepID=UPI000965B028|nr:hypothetical protein AMK33_12800 [Streptomyces sp. CB02400]
MRAARESFLREGFGVGMDAIATTAGLSEVTVYNHFGSKEALLTAVIAGTPPTPAPPSAVHRCGTPKRGGGGPEGPPPPLGERLSSRP